MSLSIAPRAPGTFPCLSASRSITSSSCSSLDQVREPIQPSTFAANGESRKTLRGGFAGGFIGTIVEAKEKTFKIEIAGDVVVEVARAAVQGLAAEEAPAAK